ncbi:PCBP3 [Branchiostoma lanceolatum]|uniref:PCBP3 protein n=1 Tax=Branchiostoma lanceolatum TaxID=7740 RepID=A0A8J9YTA9_BRALA|nr:PCBP3 [Branchiostoma lanceolatum]
MEFGTRLPVLNARQSGGARSRVMSKVIGSLIGEGSCHINEIRQFSGATIEIAEKEGDSRRSEVTISGKPDAVSSATFLINARIQAGRQAAARPSMD